MPPTPLSLDRDQIRTIRLASQGMAIVPNTPPATVVQRSGWVRTLGGADAYLAVRARQRTLRPPELDAAVGKGELRVIPAVRGCMYLVPAADVPLCLRIAEQLSLPRALREHEKAGIKKGEVDAVAKLALATLQNLGPLTTDALRQAMPKNAVRSLGEQGKKVGISSPLPAALRQLEFAGRIDRTPEGGRLDTERYLWRAAAVSPFDGARLPEEPARLHALLLERFLAHAGVASLKDFCTWAGLSQKDAKTALPHANHVPVHVAGEAAEMLALPTAMDLLRSAPVTATAAAFLPFEDNLVHLYGGPAHLVDPQFVDLSVPSWGRAGTTRLGDAPHLSLRGLVADGRLCGFWEYDPDARLAVPRCFQPPSKAATKLIEELSTSTSEFLRDLGHGHSFSLDTDDELRKRLQQLRAVGPKGRGADSAVVRSIQKGKAAILRAPARSKTAAKPAASTAKAKPKPKSRTRARTKG